MPVLPSHLVPLCLIIPSLSSIRLVDMASFNYIYTNRSIQALTQCLHGLELTTVDNDETVSSTVPL